ncbi:MAG: hybrid sensor histidine kinase/response regulator, partial [Caulobacter sp.]|nr:hybrid sensor histidine kinase/response regulator [Caulobacter sp.]
MTTVEKPLARKLLAIVVVLSIVVTGLASAATFAFVQRSSMERQVASLQIYVRERTAAEDRLFSELVKVHADATDALMRRIDRVKGPGLDARFEQMFPLQADGTRRSAPALFDGRLGADGGYTYGMGAFIANGAEVTRDEKAFFVATLQVAAMVGEAQRSRYDNFYMYTTDDRMIMFGPDRADRLDYYRRSAPADFSFQHEEMAQIMLPASNPGRVMRCTQLRKLLSDPTGKALTTGCMSPIDINGRHVASWGTTIPLDSYLMEAVEDAIPGSENVIVSGDGQLIAAPGMGTRGVVSPRELAAQEAGRDVPGLVRDIRRTGVDAGAFERDGKVIAFGHLKEPNWYFVMTMPTSDIAWSAARTASWVLLFGLLGIVVQAALLYRLVRREVVAPLETLTHIHAGGDDLAASEVELRRDEIGSLARMLQDQRRRNDDLLRSLEARVAVRTAELERANRAKSTFLANMSHELRTP